MDDIRRPNPQRRDFAMRHRPHQPRPNTTDLNQQPQPEPAQPQPAQYQPAPQPAAQPPAYHQPQTADYQTDLAPAAASETGYEHYSQPAPQPRPATRKKRLPKIPVKYAAAGTAVVILIAAGAYMLSRPAQKTGFSVAQLSKKSTFGFYYPQPLPNGYSYETKINAFQNGQAYFMLANGSKHVVFHEQASTSNLDTSGLSGTQSVQSSIGKAAIGTQAGQPAAKVLASSTLISINTTGSVPASDVTQIISHLKTDR
jgi:hypothetical protein